MARKMDIAVGNIHPCFEWQDSAVNQPGTAVALIVQMKWWALIYLHALEPPEKKKENCIVGIDTVFILANREQGRLSLSTNS